MCFTFLFSLCLLQKKFWLSVSRCLFFWLLDNFIWYDATTLEKRNNKNKANRIKESENVVILNDVSIGCFRGLIIIIREKEQQKLRKMCSCSALKVYWHCDMCVYSVHRLMYNGIMYKKNWTLSHFSISLFSIVNVLLCSVLSYAVYICFAAFIIIIFIVRYLDRHWYIPREFNYHS